MTVSKSYADYLMKWQRRRCYICGCKTIPTQGKAAGAHPTIDHVKPVSRGGRGGGDNLAWACYVCNRDKGDRPPLTCETLFAALAYAPWPAIVAFREAYSKTIPTFANCAIHGSPRGVQKHVDRVLHGNAITAAGLRF